MSSHTKLFGTDGIRGTANEYPITGELVMQAGRAAAYVFQKQHEARYHGALNRRRRAKILIGKDTRLSGYMIEMALASGICSMGVDVLLIGPMPTPGIAFLTQSMRCDAGIQISASHNPFADNGIKIFAADGYKLPDAQEAEIERLMTSKELERMRPTAADVGKAFRIDDALGRYVVQLKNVFPKDLDLQGLRVVLDCANGASYKAAPFVFEELGAERFQQFCQALLNIEYKDVQCFPVGQPDGGRDIIVYSSRKPTMEFSVFQVKFVRNPFIIEKPHNWLISQLEQELPKIEKMIPKGAKSYFLISNVPGTAHPDAGSIDRLTKVVAEYIPIEYATWWREDLSRKLNSLHSIGIKT